ncbi:MAG: helix-turn-helix domain-containing protein [Burkholderiales bacterium]|nr:helix-turn-helix domain-containing protein [Burkholderiales bacterium]
MNPRDRDKYFRNQPHRVPLGYEEYAGDKQFATTLARGIELLRCFTAGDLALSNGEFASRTGLPRPTVSRLTYTLTSLGYLRQNPKTGKYEPGSSLISVIYPMMASLVIRQRARPLMHALADATGGHVSMGIRDRLNIVLVETSRLAGREASFGPVADMGLSLPIAGTSIGRAYLAGCDGATREALLNEIRVKAPEDWQRFEPRIRSALREHERLGFCGVDGDMVEEVLAVGACYGATAGGELVVFNCTFLRSDLPTGRGIAWLRTEIGPRLVELLRQLRRSALA